MPSIDTEDIIGRPVTAVIARGKPYTYNGREIRPWEVKYVKNWDEGEIKDFSEEIPF